MSESPAKQHRDEAQPLALLERFHGDLWNTVKEQVPSWGAFSEAEIDELMKHEEPDRLRRATVAKLIKKHMDAASDTPPHSEAQNGRQHTSRHSEAHPNEVAANTFVSAVNLYAEAAANNSSQATHFEAAQAALRELVNLYDVADGDEYCHPRRVDRTWAEDAWQEQLVRGRQALLLGLQRSETPEGKMNRDPAIIAFYNATGMGKTHGLLAAGELLGAKKQLYITYNLDQLLSFDRRQPRIGILMRILLAAMGTQNIASGRCLADNSGAFSRASCEHLRSFAVTFLTSWKADGDLRNRTDVYIGVDELRLLDNDDAHAADSPARQVTSELGHLAFGLWPKGRACTCVCSSLTESTFNTISGRCIHLLKQPAVDESARSFLVGHLLPKAPEFHQQMIAACAGSHLRSCVEACRILEPPESSITVDGLFEVLKRRLAAMMNAGEKRLIKRYVKNAVLGTDDRFDGCKAIAPFVDANGAVPPVFLLASFIEDVDQKLLRQIFGAPLDRGATKQLEAASAAYDRFRARHQLPVVPPDVAAVVMPMGAFSAHDLRFTAGADVDDESLLETKDGTIVVTDHVKHLDKSKYGYPKDPCHPAIDRWCFAYDANREKTVLVIFQDKINDDMSGAVASLNQAADALEKELGVPVLCVAHVVQAGNTVADKRLKHSSIVVGNETLESYYTASFAPAVHFLIARHKAVPTV